jgi:U3 small nucleolar RNA-associated protein 14
LAARCFAITTTIMQDENRIRNHRNRAGDADDGNEYENVKKGDDESIDDDGSEVGWNSDDEVAFHSTAMYRKSKSSRKQPESDEEPDEDDEDEDVDGGILLSDMLFKNLEKANKAAASSKSKGSKGAKDESSDEESDEDESESEEDDDEDEEDDEEEEDGTGSESGSDVEDEDEDLDEVHSRLLSAIDRFALPQSSSSSKEGDGRRYNNQNSAESAFSSALDSGDVSMNALLGALDDTRGLSVVKKHLADLEKGLAAPVHVEKVVADRMERSQVYDGSKTEMKKWHATVAANRHGGTLDLTHDKRQVRSFKSMVNRFVPTTDMEKEIQMVLVQHGATDQDTEQREVDELQGRNMSMQEIREKQAELAKVKALMFYDQMKRHRLNKIKSKAYRKIQKKKKLKNGATVADDVDEEEQDAAKEKDAYNRVKERMDMRHKNTSKWAKMALQYGHTDKSLRFATT